MSTVIKTSSLDSWQWKLQKGQKEKNGGDGWLNVKEVKTMNTVSQVLQWNEMKGKSFKHSGK